MPSAAAYDALVASSSPYLYWKLNDGSVTGVDSSGNGRSSNISSGSGISAGAPGPFTGETAYSFSGAGRIGRTTGNDWANPPVAFEALVWRDPSSGNPSKVVSSERDDFGGGWSLELGASGAIQNSSFTFGTASTGVAIGNSAWHHVCWWYDGGTSTWKCYYDGSKIFDAASFGGGHRSYVFEVGAWGNVSFSNTSSPFTGRISRVAVYTGTVTEASILARAAEFLRPDPPQASLNIRPLGMIG